MRDPRLGKRDHFVNLRMPLEQVRLQVRDRPLATTEKLEVLVRIGYVSILRLRILKATRNVATIWWGEVLSSIFTDS